MNRLVLDLVHSLRPCSSGRVLVPVVSSSKP